MCDSSDDIKVISGGTVGGVGVSIGTVAASGSVVGLSATGITSGLAAIGGVVGGGMGAGLVITAGAPFAIGAGVYGIYKWIND